jgi:hypothetical protein
MLISFKSVTEETSRTGARMKRGTQRISGYKAYNGFRDGPELRNPMNEPQSIYGHDEEEWISAIYPRTTGSATGN